MGSADACLAAFVHWGCYWPLCTVRNYCDWHRPNAHRTPRANGVAIMHWAVILSALAGAVASAYLVLVHKWDAATAFFTIGGGGIALLSGMVVIVMLLAGPSERPEMLKQIRATIRSDFADVLRWLRIRR